MADRTTIARPYAKAAFAHASAAAALTEWSDTLTAAASVVGDPAVARLLTSPHVAPGKLADLVLAVLGDIPGKVPDDARRNFIHTLAEARRLGVLPEISRLFIAMKDDAERLIDVQVTSAIALDEQQKARLAASLEKRLHRRVRLQCAVDPALIGGAVLRAGDLVIDGSLRSQVDRMKYELTA